MDSVGPNQPVCMQVEFGAVADDEVLHIRFTSPFCHVPPRSLGVVRVELGELCTAE